MQKMTIIMTSIKLIKTSTLIILSSLSFLSFGQISKSKIKVEKITKYEGYVGKLDSIGTLQRINIFDTAYNKIIELDYCENDYKCRSHVDSFYTKGEYRYDQDNKFLEEKFYVFGSNNPRVIKTHFRFKNELDQVVKKLVVTTQSNDSLKPIYSDSTVYLFDYDKNGNEIRISNFKQNYRTPDAEFWAFVINYKYDKKNRLILEQRNSSSRSHKYNKKGDLIESIHHGDLYLVDGSKPTKWTYRYDENHNQIEEIQYRSDGSIFKIVSTYDHLNNKTGDYYYDEKNILIRSKEYVFNSNADLIEETEVFLEYSSVDKLIHEYEYYPE